MYISSCLLAGRLCCWSELYSLIIPWQVKQIRVKSAYGSLNVRSKEVKEGIIRIKKQKKFIEKGRKIH